MTPETLGKIAVWQAKALDGTLTLEEQREAIAVMRADRKMSASTGSSTSARRAKAKAEIPDADDMLGELGVKK